MVFTVCRLVIRLSREPVSHAAVVIVSGRVESTYEPAMTKAFKHGRTEAIRTVQPESVNFVKVGILLSRLRTRYM